MRTVALGACLTIVLAVGSFVAVRRDTPIQFWFSPIEFISVDGRRLMVVRVGYNEGLRGVESLGDLDGALFVLDSLSSADSGMGMFEARMDLDVVFFDGLGRYIERFTMKMCSAEPCETLRPSRPWQFALEAPAGSLGWIGEAAVLRR